MLFTKLLVVDSITVLVLRGEAAGAVCGQRSPYSTTPALPGKPGKNGVSGTPGPKGEPGADATLSMMEEMESRDQLDQSAHRGQLVNQS